MRQLTLPAALLAVPALTACLGAQAPQEDAPFTSRAVVFMAATAEDIDAARAGVSEEDFAVIADDLMYYRATAHEYLEDRGHEVVRLSGRRPLTFMVDGASRTYDFADTPTLDLIVVFDPGREPLAVPPLMVHLVDEYFDRPPAG